MFVSDFLEKSFSTMAIIQDTKIHGRQKPHNLSFLLLRQGFSRNLNA